MWPEHATGSVACQWTNNALKYILRKLFWESFANTCWCWQKSTLGAGCRCQQTRGRMQECCMWRHCCQQVSRTDLVLVHSLYILGMWQEFESESGWCQIPTFLLQIRNPTDFETHLRRIWIQLSFWKAFFRHSSLSAISHTEVNN